mgnify:CR=1 FL=1
MKKEIQFLQSLNNIDDSFIEEAEETITLKKYSFSFPKFAPVLAFSICLLVTILVTNHFNQEPNTMINNPYANSVSLNTAEQITGFTLEIPDIIDTTTKTYVIDQMIEVQYYDTEDNIIYNVRKAKGNDDCSGNYEVYQNEMTKEIQNHIVTLKGNDDIYYLAIWQNDKYSYSFYSYNGLDEDTITTYIEKIK